MLTYPNRQRNIVRYTVSMPGSHRHTLESITAAVQANTSMAGVLRSLGLKQSGGGQSHIWSLIRKWEIDTSHFKGQGWKSGRTFEGKPFDQIFVVYEEPLRSNFLRTKMVQYGIPYECKECHLPPEWNDKPLVLQIDHVDGNKLDNRITNIRFLCPNCHSQTDTFGVKNCNKPSEYGVMAAT